MLSILVACLIVLLAILVRKRLNYFSSRGLPYYKPTWFSILQSFTGPLHMVRYITEIYNKERDGDNPILGYISVFMTNAFLVVDPSMAQTIMIKDFSHFQDHGEPLDVATDPLNGHLFAMAGEKWRALRIKMLPTFTSGKLKGMIPTMGSCAQSVINDMKQDNRLREDVNLKDLYKRFTGAVIASCAFGIEPDSIKNPDCEYQQILKKFLNPSLFAIMKQIFMFTFPKISKLIKVKTIPREVDEYIINLTRDTMEMRKRSGIKRNDFIQLLMELKEKGSVQVDHRDLEEDEKNLMKQQQQLVESEATSKLEMTDELLAAQVFIFLVAGFDNTAYIVGLTNYFLSKNKDIQQRVREEVKAALSKHGGINYEALKDMKLLAACIDEGLRMHPSLQLLVRMCTKNYPLPNGGTIEKGSIVLLPAKLFQNDSKYWTNPEQFIPDRFLTDTILPGTYFPFGDGPRLCIAQRLALLMGKIMLAAVIDNFELLPSKKTKEPIKQKITVLSEIRGGLWGNFHLLNQ